MTETPKRPQWNHAEVKTAAVAEVFDEIKAWAISMDAVPAELDEVGEKMLLALVTLAVLESADAYEAGRYLETTYGWPTTGELIRIIDRAFLAMPALACEATHAWVMKHKVRFPAKNKQCIKFRVGEAEMTGYIVAVIAREARAIVEVGTPGKQRNMSVLAEDVSRVMKTTPSSITPPNGGGTPIAPRAGALLKKAQAA